MFQSSPGSPMKMRAGELLRKRVRSFREGPEVRLDVDHSDIELVGHRLDAVRRPTPEVLLRELDVEAVDEDQVADLVAVAQ